MIVWKRLAKLPSFVLITAVRFYQVSLGPLMGGHCRFEPSCSNYFIQAVEKYGAMVGAWKGLRRIMRCNPFFRGGYDPP